MQMKFMAQCEIREELANEILKFLSHVSSNFEMYFF